MKELWTKTLLIAAAVAVFSSLFLPYWHLKVKAPQYPKGLKVAVYVDKVKGDVGEIDILNHYIGMRPLREAARTEKKLAVPGIAAMGIALLAAVFVRRRFWALLVVPAVVFPLVFAADLYFWLSYFGTHLNPKAPLSSSVKPFVPPLFGQGSIAQFKAFANFGTGFALAAAAAVLALAAAWLRRVPRNHAVLAVFLAALACAAPADAREIAVGEGGYDTIQAALAAAAAGDTVTVAPGVYRGPLTVDKSVTLTGKDFPVIDGGGRGTVVRLTAPGVVFKGFVVRASGDVLSAEDTGIVASAKNAVIEDNVLEDVLFGIYLRTSSASVVRGNRLSGKPLDVARRGDLVRVWYSDNVILESNRMRSGRDVVLWFSKNMRVVANEVSDARYGLHFMYCRDAVVERNVLTRNSVGAYLMYSASLALRGNVLSENRGPSGFGLGLKDMTDARVEENVVVNNRVGVFVDATTRTLAARNLVGYNDVGVQIVPSASRNVFSANNFVDNGEQVQMDGASARTVNFWEDNYWSDYRGYDAGGDGTGDVPYRSMKLFERLTDGTASLKVFAGSPSVQAVEFAATAFPIFEPVARFSDDRPGMTPVPLGAAGRGAAAPREWAWLSVGLLLPAFGFVRL